MKSCFDSQSGAGLRFVERILTLTETACQNGVCAFDNLTRAITASRSGAPALRLLPPLNGYAARRSVGSSPRTRTALMAHTSRYTNASLISVDSFPSSIPAPIPFLDVPLRSTDSAVTAAWR